MKIENILYICRIIFNKFDMKTKIFLIALISAVMFSCSEEEIDRSDNKEKKSEIQVTNNLLVFPNEESLVSALNNDLPDPIKASFKSQRSIFDTLTEREYRRALFLRNLSDEEYYKVDRHCDYYRELLKTNFIKRNKFRRRNPIISIKSMYAYLFKCFE